MSPARTQLGEFGPYVLLEQIAVGGMAEIYLAKTRGVAGFEKYLCLKLIHPNFADDEHFIQMLIDEAKISVGLNHANIVQIFDLGRDESRYYIAMEYIDGADLFKVMRRLSEKDIDVPIDVAAFVAQEICTGLDYAHRKRDANGRPLGIIHRDISPQNILLSINGEVKIVDFGIAKAASRSRRTQAGVIKGKYYYMSPEQAWGDPVDQRTDIFSAGIILYEVLTGQMLYLEEDMHRLLDMVRKADIPRPSTRRPDIPPQLENVTMKALAKRPADRWQTAHEFQSALTNFLFSYAPDFTATRVAKLLESALADEVRGAVPERRPVTRQVEVDELMSRVDFRPQGEHSVLFRLGDLKPQPIQTPTSGSFDADEVEDRGERTMISGPPSMISHHLAPAAALPDGSRPAWEDDDGPTMINRNPGLRPQDLDLELAAPGAQPPGRSVEILVSPGLSLDTAPAQELTPTPMLELTEQARRTASPAPPPRAAPGRSPLPARPSPPARAAPPPPPGAPARRATPGAGVASVRPLPGAPPPAQAGRPPGVEPAAQGGGTPVDRAAAPQPDGGWPWGGASPGSGAWPPGHAPQVRLQWPPAPAQQQSQQQPTQWPPGGQQQRPAQWPPGPQQPAQWPPGSQQQQPAQWPPGSPQQPAQWPPGSRQQPAQWPPGSPQQPAQWPPVGAAQQAAAQPAPWGGSVTPQPAAQWPPGAGTWPAQATPQPVLQQQWPPGGPSPAPSGPAWPAGGTGAVWPAQAGDGVDATWPTRKPRRRLRNQLLGLVFLFLLLVGAGIVILLMIPTVEEGKITIISLPPAAAVTFDGKPLAQPTPVVISVPEVRQPHTVEVQLRNYQPFKQTITFAEDQTNQLVYAYLVPMFGTLRVKSLPEGADVYVNSNHRGRTNLVIERLPRNEDDINIELRKRGYRPVTRTLQWQDRTELTVDETLKRSQP